ncbi:transketolase [Bradyrhizobium neotropicale]|uniref:transketolase n=1 Tax=Bradyrhizobium neotropicale TaxID=1497615 RepID=UPI001AD686B2|nr:transketolase [Bradyrhizobium neotropicale]MBO4228410.1 transketolase [Bradyrhizobium neotropicale]
MARETATKLPSAVEMQKEDELLCSSLRARTVSTIRNAGGGHIGSSLSLIEILYCLFFRFLRIDPLKPNDPNRDRFILSSCQGAVALFAVMEHRGFLLPFSLERFLARGSELTMFPTTSISGVEMTGGSLGHGIAFGIGTALSAKKFGQSYLTVALIGDGEMNEGSIWEAALAGSHLKLGNLLVIVNRNRLQIDGPTESIMTLEPVAEKWKAFGWDVQEVNGHSVSQIGRALDVARANAETSPCPRILIAHTTKGRGISFMENSVEWHYRVPSEAEYGAAMQELLPWRSIGDL